ncbi:ABC transporter substrate-binding protein [Paenibacillus beijingensis]|uniref:ABC transporter substrate-binding protein n=1 Tax=Paenibacillus beijingensis TaxID=1126833 RepID=A0A0D5NDP0_9BACL|nr:sugar ABC transporter substrate-binding protein [Paenibacillus beijingensis]AJY73346.1 ABC transporter substrate-binding protein [Paenibacillus beijingensis]
MNKMRKWVTKRAAVYGAGAVLAILPVLGGCAGGNAGDNAASGSNSNDGGEPVTITYYTIDSPDRTFVEQLIPDFEKKHPNIKVKVATAPYEQFDSKLQTMIAGGSAPDVTSHFGYGGFAEYYNKDMLLDLTDMLSEDGFKASDYNIPDSVMDIYKVNGRTYGVPVNSYVTLMLYNKDLFDKANVPYPPSDYNDKSWTFDKMVEYAKKLTILSDDPSKQQYGVDFTWAERDNKPLYFGAKTYSDDTWTNGGVPSETYFDSPETIAAYHKFYDLIFKDNVSPTAEWSKSVAGQGGDPFVTGKVAMSVGGSWILAGSNDFGFNVGVAAVPAGGNDKVRSILYVDPLFVLKDSKHPKEALQWIKYLIDTDVQKKSIELSGGNPPVNQVAAEDYYGHFNGVDAQDVKNVYQGAFAYGYESFNHLITNYSQINDLFINEMQPIENGTKSIEEVMPGIQSKMNELLQRSKK